MICNISKCTSILNFRFSGTCLAVDLRLKWSKWVKPLETWKWNSSLLLGIFPFSRLTWWSWRRRRWRGSGAGRPPRRRRSAGWASRRRPRWRRSGTWWWSWWTAPGSEAWSPATTQKPNVTHGRTPQRSKYATFTHMGLFSRARMRRFNLRHGQNGPFK